jgi:hypothetical protein
VVSRGKRKPGHVSCALCHRRARLPTRSFAVAQNFFWRTRLIAKAEGHL